MLKTLLLVVGGLGAGLAIAFWLQPSPATPPAEAEATRESVSVEGRSGNETGVSEARLAALEDALAAEAERRGALEARVAELSAELEALGERPPLARGADAANGGPDDGRIRPARAREEAERRMVQQRGQLPLVEQLVAAGFAPDRAEWINRRTQELRMEAMQAQYEARRDGRPPPADLGENALRTELGDQDYERFLTATGRPTNVNIMGVLASSPAERAGLQPGDEIVAYNGQRVFDVMELNELTLGGTTGESVVIDVRRNGQSMQLVMPRGPLGIWGGFRGPPLAAGR